MRFLASLIACLAFAHAASAHEFWIAPEAYTVAAGEPIVADLRVGQDFAGARQSYVPDNFARFEVKMDRPHHDHMICTQCGKIIEFNHPLIEKLQEEVAANQGFRMTSHKLDLFGICKDCR